MSAIVVRVDDRADILFSGTARAIVGNYWNVFRQRFGYEKFGEIREQIGAVILNALVCVLI